MKLPRLEALRQELSAGLAWALRASSQESIEQDRAQQAAADVIAGLGLPQDIADHFGRGPVARLLCFDADRIQSWVFGSEKVQVAAGGSHLLKSLNDRLRTARDLPEPLGLLYSAGGGGMFFASASTPKAEQVANFQRWLEDQSHELTFTVISEELFVADFLPGQVAPPLAEVAGLKRFRVMDGMQGALTRARIRMRSTKDSQPRFAPPVVFARHQRPRPRIERCSSCGRRPPGDSSKSGPASWCSWCRGLRAALPRGTFEREGDSITFPDLAQALPSSGRDYLGFIALDGNNMGSVTQELRSFLDLRVFSEATEAVFENARQRGQAVLEQVAKELEGATDLPCLSLLSGGDEITFVLPAAAAPAVVVTLLRAIEEGFEELTRASHPLHEAFCHHPEMLERLRGLGAAAGVIVAHSNYPVRLLRKYANALQREAKRACAGGLRSAVAWLLMTDASPLTVGPGQEVDGLAVDHFAAWLRSAEIAREIRLPRSALQGLLNHHRAEEQALEGLAGEPKNRVLAQVSANFFRYQLARNEALRLWWDRSGLAPSERGEGEDDVAAWFRKGGAQELAHLLDLMSLSPVPLPAMDVEDEAS